VFRRLYFLTNAGDAPRVSAALISFPVTKSSCRPSFFTHSGIEEELATGTFRDRKINDKELAMTISEPQLQSHECLEVELVRNITVIRFVVESLNEQTFEDVSNQLHQVLAKYRSRQVVIDLGSVQYADDLGLAMLQSFHDSVEELGGTAILCRLSPQVTKALNESDLHRWLHIRPSLNEAIWTF
jgi:anti-anti-sigma factor